MSTETDDFSTLIHKAASQIDGSSKRQAPRRDKPASPAFRFALIAVLVIAIGYAAMVVMRSRQPPTAQAIAHDLEAAVESAHQSIEKGNTETGKLPESLPNASLASVVKYERRDQDYKLTASTFGVRVTLEWDGKTKTEIDP